MALVTNDKLKLTANSLVGGNIVAIALRAAMRIKAMSAAAQREAFKQNLATGPEPPYTVPFRHEYAAIPIEVRKQETFSYSADVTQHAVESGVQFTEHIILKPIRIDVSFEVTNLTPQAARNTLLLLESVWQAREHVTLITEHRALNDMVLVNFRAENALPHWGALAFTASFQQVKLVTLETLATAKGKTKAVTKSPSATRKVEAGAQPVSTPRFEAEFQQ
jgi:hypothetical protein